MWTDSRVRRYGGVTLVEVTVGNDGTRSRRVRIESELDGPVWPPRTRGVPDAEWDGDAIAARVDPGDRRSFGFATPALPADPAVSVTVDEAATDGGTTTPADVVRALGDPRPPRDALGDPFRAGRGRPPGPRRHDDGDPDPTGSPGGRTGSDDGGTPAVGSPASTGRDGAPTVDGDPAGEGPTDDGRESTDPTDPGAPPAIDAWFDAIAAGIDADGGRPEASEQRADAGDRLPDPAVLRAVAGRADALSRRLAGRDTRSTGDRDRRGSDADGEVGRP